MITFKDISIIIPVGPGESALKAPLEDLRSIEKEAELIVVRGASRPNQQNEGARKATRDVCIRQFLPESIGVSSVFFRRPFESRKN